jgi:hypothetical protein
MNYYAKIFFSFLLTLAIISFGWPTSSIGDNLFVKGKDSAEKAARFDDSPTTQSPTLRNLPSFTSQPDSVETVLFEDEEERNLIKEITVWIIGAAFVGYFIVKVFLEGDTDDEEEEQPGKEIPGGGVSSSVPLFSF